MSDLISESLWTGCACGMDGSMVQGLAQELKNSLGTPPLMGISDSEREGCRTVSPHGKTTYDHDDAHSTIVTHNSWRGHKEENAAICTLKP